MQEWEVAYNVTLSGGSLVVPANSAEEAASIVENMSLEGLSAATHDVSVDVEYVDGDDGHHDF